MQYDTCKAGVSYPEILARNPNHHATGIPCLNQTNETCPLQSWPSPDEIKAEEERVNRAVTQFLTDIASNVCPHCKQPIEHKEQVGRCVYARPCNHRLYQGEL
jgi:hypothetical protein